MSWAVGFDTRWSRDIGYGVPAFCDEPGCEEVIDRGLSYVCCNSEPYGGDHGCGLYFCEKHQKTKYPDDEELAVPVCDHGDGYVAKPDHPAWIKHKLTDPSWAEWRAKNPVWCAANDGPSIFHDVALYTASEFMGNIVRIDCKAVKVATGQKYAQYDDAVKITFRAKGKRRDSEKVLTFRPWLRILDLKHAVEPDGIYGAPDGSGCAKGRYRSFDPGWKRDFEAKLAGVPVALSIGGSDEQ